jgi:hypothetical protein
MSPLVTGKTEIHNKADNNAVVRASSILFFKSSLVKFCLMFDLTNQKHPQMKSKQHHTSTTASTKLNTNQDPPVVSPKRQAEILDVLLLARGIMQIAIMQLQD